MNGKEHFPAGFFPAYTFDSSEAPDLGAASSVLGGWLESPPGGPDLSAPGWSAS